MSSVREELAADFERGKPWNPRKDQDAPNPLYGVGVNWSQGTTGFGTADFLTVRDDAGVVWSILVGSYDLKKSLLVGEVSTWNETAGKYEVTDVLGPVKAGELLAIELRGERTYTNKQGKQVTTPSYNTLRKPAPETDEEEAADEATSDTPEEAVDDDIPW
jgi:hypothetical protein